MEEMELANLNTEMSQPSLVMQAGDRRHLRRAALLSLLLSTLTAGMYLAFRWSRAAMAELRVINYAAAQPGSPEAMARCLDGSEYAYYVRPGHGTGKSKWMIWFDGGDVCTSLEDCTAHAKSSSSSNGYRQTPQLDLSQVHHTFSTNAIENPLMWNWNWIYLPDCDGGYYSGQASEPLATGSEPSHLFFRGWYNALATFDQMKRASDLNGGLTNATDVLIAGCSAGTVGTFLHLDRLRSQLPQSTTVRGYASSGFFMPTPKYLQSKQYIWKEMNVSSSVSQSCLMAEWSGWACLAGANAASYVKTPMFMVQGMYDSVQLTEAADSGCLWNISCANAYGNSVRHRAQQWLAASGDRGLFLQSCISHCGRQVMAVHGVTPLLALNEWWGNTPVNLTQVAHYPCLTCCLGPLW